MPTNLPNRASISYNGSGVVLSNQTNTTLIDQYTVELTKTPVVDTVIAGGDAVYVISLANTGAGALDGATLTDNLGGTETPLSYVDGSAQFYMNGELVTGTATPDADGIVFGYADTITPGDNLLVIYAASVGIAQTGTITNTVTADVPTAEQTQRIIVAQASATITITPVANVSIFKAASADTVQIGDTLTYTFTLMNTGSEAAENINFTDALPEQFNVTSVSYTADGTETPIADTDYTIEAPNTLIIPADGSTLEIDIPAATEEGPGITTITVTGTINGGSTIQ
ncbi:MAG: DUF11 domain-containing protein [Clostridia bacterium]|nr:DUF11 domain-containing protein [Clostridia bacterium]